MRDLRLRPTRYGTLPLLIGEWAVAFFDSALLSGVLVSALGAWFMGSGVDGRALEDFVLGASNIS